MSASLVGSEMCIRDRALTSESPLLPVSLCGGGPPLSTGRAGHGGAAGAPVSYTHLTLPTICSV
eukprot:9543859-Alexandrium_andersonii.AAC.1